MTISEAKIPYTSGDESIADTYNRVVKESPYDWVLMMDHDVLLAVNPDWRAIIERAIEEVDYNSTALITCVTGDRGGRLPQSADIPAKSVRSFNMKEHLHQAARLYEKYGEQLSEVNTNHVAGFFMIVNKEIWKELKFHRTLSKLKGIDHDYVSRALEAGYKIYTMPGLYVYHMKYRYCKRKELL